MTYYTAEWINTGSEHLRDYYIEVHQGVIVTISPLKELSPRAFRDMIAFEDAVITPGLINTAISASLWRHQPLLSQSSNISLIDNSLESEASLFASALACYAEQARQGVTTLMDWSLAEWAHRHANRPVFESDLAQKLVPALIRAARQVGIRLSIAMPVMDSQHWTESQKQWGLLEAITGQGPEDSGGKMTSLSWIFAIQDASDWSKWQEILRHTPLRGAVIWWLKHPDVIPQAVNKLASIFSTPQTVAAQSTGWLAEAKLPKDWCRLLGQSDIFSAGQLQNTPAIANNSSNLCLTTGWPASAYRFSVAQTLKWATAVGMLSKPSFQSVTEHAAHVLQQPVGKLQPGTLADFAVLDLEHPSLMPSMISQANHFDLSRWLISAWDQSALKTVLVGGHKVYHLGAWQHVQESHLASLLAESQNPSGHIEAASANHVTRHVQISLSGA
jgi:cytosine/adenosine deaminase-related metal-dependent hydrolase